MILKKVGRYRKGLLLVALLALIAAGGWAYYQHKTSTTTETETTDTVGRGDIRATVSATGTIKAVNSVSVGSRVTGLITEVKVNENDIVKKGQVLGVLDDTALRAQLEQYEAQVSNYASAYERSRKIFAIGGESAQQLDSDRMNYRVAKANYDNLAAQLTYYVITAPIDGMVVGTPSSVGTTVVQGLDTAQTILTIADMAKMQIKVLVDESDIGKIRVDQQVSFTVDAYADKTFTGKVTKVSRDATTSSNVVYYPVYVAVDAPEDLLYPTMTARVTINVGERKQVLIVPLAAIKEDKGQKYVQVMVNGHPQNTPVKIGLSDEDNVEAVTGLNEGDQIVIPAAKAKVTTSQDQGPPPRI
ncbi:MAG: efflux RND transporter periplasmic adaptor subunit [Negativicutes bacterium]|nr:efflux RND transporter periplasmic adaptor subunit [Negativicutes bacterium]